MFTFQMNHNCFGDLQSCQPRPVNNDQMFIVYSFLTEEALMPRQAPIKGVRPSPLAMICSRRMWTWNCPICRHTFHVLAAGGPDCYLSDVESGENLAWNFHWHVSVVESWNVLRNWLFHFLLYCLPDFDLWQPSEIRKKIY